MIGSAVNAKIGSPTPRAVVGVGDAVHDLVGIPSLPENFHGTPRLTVAAYRLAPTTMWRRGERELLDRHLDDLWRAVELTGSPGVAIVLDIVGPRVWGARRRALKILDYFVTATSIASTNSLGHDITVFGIVISSSAERLLVSARLRELASSPINWGDKVCLHASTLQHDSLRDVFNQELL